MLSTCGEIARLYSTMQFHIFLCPLKLFSSRQARTYSPRWLSQVVYSSHPFQTACFWHLMASVLTGSGMKAWKWDVTLLDSQRHTPGWSAGNARAVAIVQCVLVVVHEHIIISMSANLHNQNCVLRPCRAHCGHDLDVLSLSLSFRFLIFLPLRNFTWGLGK